MLNLALESGVYLEMHVHVCPGRVVINLWLDIGNLVSVQVILTLIPTLF